MQRALLDTDILSEILKRKAPTVIRNATKYASIHKRYTFTAVSVHEIYYGLESKGAIQQLQKARVALAAHEIIVPILSDYEVAGLIRGKARKQGCQLAIDDCLIAAVAGRLGLSIVTGNTSHFRDIQDAGLPITIDNWREI